VPGSEPGNRTGSAGHEFVLVQVVEAAFPGRHTFVEEEAVIAAWKSIYRRSVFFRVAIPGQVGTASDDSLILSTSGSIKANHFSTVEFVFRLDHV